MPASFSARGTADRSADPHAAASKREDTSPIPRRRVNVSASKSRAACRISNWIALSFILGQLGIAQAFLPPDDGSGGGGGGGGGTQITRCLENTVVYTAQCGAGDHRLRTYP